MIFQKTIKQVLDHTKTQTRRLVQPGDWGCSENLNSPLYSAVFRNGRLLYKVGKIYAAQPGRGQPAAGRIRLKSIRKERVNEIGEADCFDEGAVPTGLITQPIDPVALFRRLWDTIHTGAAAYEAGPEVWCLEFSLVEEVLK